MTEKKVSKFSGIFALLAVLGILLFAGCAQNDEKSAPATTLKADEKTFETAPAKTGQGSSGAAWCVPGSGYNLGGVSFKRTGIESHALNGVSMDLCCGLGESARTGEKTKKCSSEKGDRDYSITWLATKKTGGEYALSKEIYQQDGKMCIRLFDDQGKEEKVTCTQEP
jgi:hypothetical protein